MAKQDEAPVAKEEEEAESGSEEDSEVEAADIEAIARSHLKDGETILGEGEPADAKPKARGICNRPALLKKLEELEYKTPQGAKRVPWVDTLTIDGSQPLPKGVGPKDGVKLESTFLRVAGDAVREAYSRLRVMKVPCHRPDDFYAEMFRPDNIMYKVRARAAEEQRRMKIVEDRKKFQAAKKFAKKSKSKKIQARALERKQTLADIKDWQKKGKRDKKNVDEQDLESILSRNNKQGKGDGKGKGKGKGKEGGKKQGFKKSKKREAADTKFGFGGKKKRVKSNDSKSVNDFSASPWGGDQKGKGKSKGKGKGAAKGAAKGKGKGKGMVKKMGKVNKNKGVPKRGKK